MPCILKVKIISARNLPIMDRKSGIYIFLFIYIVLQEECISKFYIHYNVINILNTVITT